MLLLALESLVLLSSAEPGSLRIPHHFEVWFHIIVVVVVVTLLFHNMTTKCRVSQKTTKDPAASDSEEEAFFGVPLWKPFTEARTAAVRAGVVAKPSEG